MNTQKIAETIRKIAPKFAADSADILWLETELDKVSEKSLPKLIRKRFSASFRVAAAPRSLVTISDQKPASGGQGS